MKKIVKCLIPIVSGISLLTPTFVACSKANKVLPDDYYILERLTEQESKPSYVVKGVKDKKDIPSWDGYDTMKMPSDVEGIYSGALVPSGIDERFDNIKYLNLDSDKLFYIYSLSIGNFSKLEEITFGSNLTMVEAQAFNVLPSLGNNPRFQDEQLKKGSFIKYNIAYITTI